MSSNLDDEVTPDEEYSWSLHPDGTGTITRTLDGAQYHLSEPHALIFNDDWQECSDEMARSVLAEEVIVMLTGVVTDGDL